MSFAPWPTRVPDGPDHRAPSIPVVAAPMAGGPSTPALAAAVSDAGGLGFLAGGMLSAAQLVDDVRSVRERTDAAFGVNLFVPEPANTAVPADRRAPDSAARRRRSESVARYRSSLVAEADRLGVELPAEGSLDPDALDDWEATLDAAESGGWPLVTFTFGLPAAVVFDRLHAAGCAVGVTVTSPDEAVRALENGADLLSVQGPESGGHRSVHDPAADPGTTALVPLLAEVRAAVETARGPGVPLLAAGGIMDAAGVREVLAAGATAAQCGSAFLLASEAGTSAVHRRAVEQAVAGTGFVDDDGSARTALTRAFSGRWARGLANRFMREHPDVPAAYPEVNSLTGPLRKAAAAAGDAESTSLWAGVGVAEATAAPAADIVRRLSP